MANIHVSTGKTNINVGLNRVYPPLINLEVTPTVEEQIFNHEGEYGYDIVTVKPINLKLQDKETNVTKNKQIITADDNYDALNSVTINAPELQDKTITPSEEEQEIYADDEFLALNSVKVEAIPEEYTKVEGTLTLTKNGEYDVKEYANVKTEIYESIKLEEKDINFFDYDGELLYSWSLEELAEKTELPVLPEHEGLVCQGWNWTLEDLQQQNLPMDVGAIYITDDDKTRIYIHLEEGRTSPVLGIGQSKANGIEIDWGDGTTNVTGTTTGASSIINTKHTYSRGGDYVITLTSLNDSTIYFIGNSSMRSTYLLTSSSATSSSNRVYANAVSKIELGKNVYFNFYALTQLNNLETITIANGTKTSSNATYLFQNDYSLRFVAIPQSMTTIGGDFCTYAKGLKNISLPRELQKIPIAFTKYCANLKRVTISNNVTEIGNDAFRDNVSLTELFIPNSVKTLGTYICSGCSLLKKVDFQTPVSITSIPQSFLASCYTLRDFEIPYGVVAISSTAFNANYSLTKLKVPSTVKTLQMSCFTNQYSMTVFDFSTHTLIPTIQNGNAFNNIPADCKIVVPDDLYDEWIIATNWATVASNIINVSEWEVQQ